MLTFICGLKQMGGLAGNICRAVDNGDDDWGLRGIIRKPVSVMEHPAKPKESQAWRWTRCCKEARAFEVIGIYRKIYVLLKLLNSFRISPLSITFFELKKLPLGTERELEKEHYFLD